MIRKDVRMSLDEHSHGVNLEIRNLNVDDAGNYICEVENEAEPIQQSNQLQILGELSWSPYISELFHSNCLLKVELHLSQHGTFFNQGEFESEQY